MGIIGKTIRVDGEVSGTEDLLVQGRIEGTVNLPGQRVVVAAGGSIGGDLRAASVEIRGRFDGRIVAGGIVQLARTARASGSILTAQVAMADGAVFRGALETREPSSGRSDEDSGSVGETTDISSVLP